MKKVISVRFKENGKSYYFDPGDAIIHAGEYVIVETARGVECGEVVQGVLELADAAVPKALKPITRMADSVDIRRMRQNREDEKRAYHTCQECIARHGLEMKLVEAEYTLDRSKIMFYFTADGRVDFRELVKDLAGIFHTRIKFSDNLFFDHDFYPLPHLRPNISLRITTNYRLYFLDAKAADIPHFFVRSASRCFSSSSARLFAGSRGILPRTLKKCNELFRSGSFF